MVRPGTPGHRIPEEYVPLAEVERKETELRELRQYFAAMEKSLAQASEDALRLREALDTVSFHHDISPGALDYLGEALDG